MAPRDPVKSARRVLEILERFEAEKRPLGVSEIAQVLGYPLSSTSMLLNTLAQFGYLNLDPASRKFAPTMSVAMLGDWIVSGDEGRSRVKAVIDDARRLSGLTAVLSTRNGIDVQYVYVLRAPESNFRSRSPGAGTLRPILRSSPGIALMAGLDDRQIALIVRRVRATRGEDVSLDGVMTEVNRYRRQGYAWDAGRVYADVGSVAVRLPVDDVFGKALVLGVAGAASRIAADHARIAGTLRRLIARRLTPRRPVARASARTA